MLAMFGRASARPSGFAWRGTPVSVRLVWIGLRGRAGLYLVRTCAAHAGGIPCGIHGGHAGQPVEPPTACDTPFEGRNADSIRSRIKRQPDECCGLDPDLGRDRGGRVERPGENASHRRRGGYVRDWTQALCPLPPTPVHEEALQRHTFVERVCYKAKLGAPRAFR